MPVAATLHDTLREVLLATDPTDTALWVEAQRAVRNAPAVVHLVEDDCSTDEALAYARTLWELGRDDETDEVIEAVLDAAFGAGVPTETFWPGSGRLGVLQRGGGAGGRGRLGARPLAES